MIFPLLTLLWIHTFNTGIHKMSVLLWQFGIAPYAGIDYTLAAKQELCSIYDEVSALNVYRQL